MLLLQRIRVITIYLFSVSAGTVMLIDAAKHYLMTLERPKKEFIVHTFHNARARCSSALQELRYLQPLLVLLPLPGWIFFRISR